MLFVNPLLAQETSPEYREPADLASGLITTIGTFVIAGLLVFFGYRLLISGSRPEKSGVEIAGFKVNLESTTGSFLIVASLVILLIYYNNYY